MNNYFNYILCELNNNLNFAMKENCKIIDSDIVLTTLDGYSLIKGDYCNSFSVSYIRDKIWNDTELSIGDWESFLDQFVYLRMKVSEPTVPHHNAKHIYFFNHFMDLDSYRNSSYLGPNPDNKKVYENLKEIKALIDEKEERKEYKYLNTTLEHPVHDEIEHLIDTYIKLLEKFTEVNFNEENLKIASYYSKVNVKLEKNAINYYPVRRQKKSLSIEGIIDLASAPKHKKTKAFYKKVD